MVGQAASDTLSEVSLPGSMGADLDSQLSPLHRV